MIDTVPDSALHQRFEANSRGEFDLDSPANILDLVRSFWNEWCNGGFAQLFCNWYPADVKLISQGLREVGAPEAAAIVEKAIAELAAPDQWRGQGHRALIESSDPLGARLWDLNREFDSHERGLEKLIAAYELKLSAVAKED